VRLSEARISHLAHTIITNLWRDDLVDFADEGDARATAKETLSRLFSAEEEVDGMVRQKLDRQHKTPGSREWQVMYDKYFREEMDRRKL
jgi:uncharacterized protein